MSNRMPPVIIDTGTGYDLFAQSPHNCPFSCVCDLLRVLPGVVFLVTVLSRFIGGMINEANTCPNPNRNFKLNLN